MSTFFNERMEPLGLTQENNEFKAPIWKGTAEVADIDHWEDRKLFTEDEYGNIEIHYHSVAGAPMTYRKGTNKNAQTYIPKRLKEPVVKPNGDVMKYFIPPGSGTFPFITPGLINKYLNKEHIDTLVLTEGAFKAFKGWICGLDIIGLTSISHYRDKSTNTLHADVLRIIKTCTVEKIIWLVDGDCQDLSSKFPENLDVDLYSRPNFFYTSARNIRTLLREDKTIHDMEYYFAHINSADIDGHPKGLDDLYIEEAGKAEKDKEPVDELYQVINTDLLKENPSKYFTKLNLTMSLNRLTAHFSLQNHELFYLAHKEVIEDKIFIFHGTKYQYNHTSNSVEVRVPGEASLYARVGDDYYKWVNKPDKYGNQRQELHRRRKATIIDDHGKGLCEHIPKLEAFCNLPDHINFQQYPFSCFNIYYPFKHEPEPGGCEITLGFLQHIFGAQQINFTHPKTKEKLEVNELDLGLDYVQLLYRSPTQMLPILCLVSKERGTGKSTLAKWLKALFGLNMAVVGNADLSNDFNSAWATKLIVCCEEVFVDKKLVLEKIKSLSTSDTITMNAKGRDQIEMDFFAKFIFMSNNEENFIYTSADEVRYWVRKVPPINDADLNIALLEQMIEEIPAFLAYMDKRKMATEDLHRAWFHPPLIKTEALMKVVEHNRSTIEKEVRTKIGDMFLTFGETEIFMTTADINNEFFRNKYEHTYLNKVLKEEIELDRRKDKNGKYSSGKYSFPKIERIMKVGSPENVRVDIKGSGRPFVFELGEFVTDIDMKDIVRDEELTSLEAIPAKDVPEQDDPFKKDDTKDELFDD